VAFQNNFLKKLAGKLVENQLFKVHHQHIGG
jgi:hypothetical protein